MAYGNYPDLQNVKKVLVIKLRQLGDVLLTTPVFSSLKAHLPNAQIDAYVYTESFPLLEGHPAITNLIGYDRSWKKLSLLSRLRKEFALLRQIRHNNYDLVINLTEGDRGAIAALFSRAPIRVGLPPKGKWQKKLYTHIAKSCPTLRHNVERNLDLLRRIGIFPSQEQRELFLLIPPLALLSAHAKVQGPFVLIHPTSRWKFKCWPVDKMRTVVQELLAQGKQVVLTSGPDKEELQMVNEIAQNLPVINLSGQITLSELSALISMSELLICVDSLPFHMASALKYKVIALFGPTSDISWGPWRNPNAKILTQNLPCRPCYQDGCGGSKHSDCLATLPVSVLVNCLNKAFVRIKHDA